MRELQHTDNTGSDGTPVATTETTPAVTTDTVRMDAGNAVADAAAAAAAALDSTEMALKAGWAKLGRDGRVEAGRWHGGESAGQRRGKPLGDVHQRPRARQWTKPLGSPLDRVLFHTGTSRLLPDSQEQLDITAAILKAYPAVKLKLGGYTDSRGDAAMNLKLSGERAASIKAKLESMGVAADRLEAEGYGAQHPLASNDTPDGRQQNRRVDVRVTAK